MPRRKCIFNKNLEAMFPFLETTKSNSDLHCLQCGGRFSIASGGKYDIQIHLKAKKHIKANKIGEFTQEDVCAIPDLSKVKQPTPKKMTMCRLCKKYTNNEKAKNLFHKEQEFLLTKIMELTSSTLHNDIDLPNVICLNCEGRLNRAHKFRMLCLKSFAFFDSIEYKKLIHKKSNEIIKNDDENEEAKPQQLEEVMLDIKEELNSSDANENDMLAMNNESDNSIYSNDPCLELELSESIDLSKDNSNCSEENNDSRSDSNSITDSCLELEICELTDLSKTTPNCGSDSNSIHETNILEIDLNESKYLSNVTPSCAKNNEHIKKSTDIRSKKDCKGKNDFICEHCGNHFNSRQHFVTHLRRHTNIKPFKCEICPKQCYTSSELKHHIRRHTGERPFACRYCERRFADFSTRVRHERTHTNERPYSCVQCGKAFTRSNLLQKHLLVHTGERAFECTECNKSFQTRTSLNVHCRSIMHRRSVRKHEIDKEMNQLSNPNDNIVVLKIQT